MNLITGINQFIGLFISTVKQVLHARTWLALLLYFLLSVLVLYAHYDFLAPFFYPLIKGWVSLFGEDSFKAFSHYPGHFLYLPYYFSWAKIVFGLLFEGLVLGTVAVFFADRYRHLAGTTGTPFKEVLRLMLQFIAAWVIFNGMTVLVNLYLPDMLAAFHQDSPRRLMAVRFVLQPLVLVVIFAMLFFALPIVAVYRVNFLKAVGRSLRLFFRRPLTCLFLAGIIMIVPYIVSAVPPDVIITKFKPELVFWIMLFGLAVETVASYFWMGTAVRFMLEEESS
ncbi:MAG: hypothetical protein ACOYVF_14510 [Candidatus Zixiibacteriota bacterium]